MGITYCLTFITVALRKRRGGQDLVLAILSEFEWWSPEMKNGRGPTPSLQNLHIFQKISAILL